MCNNHRQRAHRLDKHRDTIVQMLEQGVSRTDIADAVNVHLSSLNRYLLSRGLSKGHPVTVTDDHKTWLKKHYGTMTIHDMADTLGINRGAVYGYLVRHGIHQPEKRERTRIRADILSGRWGC